jgi:type IV fimbrial biogenesis protein FimT
MKTSDKRIGMATLARTSGFTMIELLMTIAVGSILMVLAVPSFRYVTNANRISAEINGLLGDLQFARAEAMKEGRTVTVCQSTTGTSCTGTATDWQGGWIVFSDPTNTGVVGTGGVLRFQKPFSGSDTFSASNGLAKVTFNREGYAAGTPNGTLITLHSTPITDAWTRCLTLSLVGQVTTEKVGGNANGATCS